MTLAELRAAVLSYLGTTSTDKAYPPATLTRWLNDALNELRADMPPGYLQVRGTWDADGGSGRVYTLASQAVPVASLARIVEVRLSSTTGSTLRELSYEQLNAWSGSAYAITGADEVAVLTTCESVSDGATLYVVYEEWPAALSTDADTPTWLSARFHDVPALMAAETAFSSGDEGRMPAKLEAKLLDRRAQLTSHTRRRSPDVMLTRTATNLVA